MASVVVYKDCLPEFSETPQSGAGGNCAAQVTELGGSGTAPRSGVQQKWCWVTSASGSYNSKQLLPCPLNTEVWSPELLSEKCNCPEATML